MKKNDYKLRNSILQHTKEMNAKSIMEEYPKIDYVKVEITLHYHTSVCATKPEIKNSILKSDHKVYLYYQCPNGDCTGSGFDLTAQLEECLRIEQIVEGVLYCNGKEDPKYLHAKGCSCDTSCKFRIIPVLK